MRSILTLLAALVCLGASQAQAASFTFNNASCNSYSLSGSNGAYTVNCDQVSTPVTSGAPTGCSLTASPTSLPSSGGSVTLTAGCSTGNPTSFSWSKNPGGAMSVSSASTTVNNVTQSTTYTVTASNSTGSASPVSASVVVASAGGGGGGDAISCQGFAATTVMNVDWNTVQSVGYQQLYTSNFGGFADNTALVIKFTTGSHVLNQVLGRISLVEFASGGPVARTGAVSTTACDFSTGLGVGSQVFGQIGPTFFYAVGTAPFYSISLQPNTTYFINLKNENAQGQASCTQGVACDMQMTFTKPPGL